MLSHRQAVLTPSRGRDKRPAGRAFRSLGRRRAALVMLQHHGAPHSLPKGRKARPGYHELLNQDTRTFSVLFVVALLSATVTLAADRFVSGVADLPLMPGLEEIDGSAMVFSKPQGRIIEVMASGAVSRDAVRAFYDRALPQLGWRRVEANSWLREHELLRFDMRDQKKGLVIQFSLTPQ